MLQCVGGGSVTIKPPTGAHRALPGLEEEMESRIWTIGWILVALSIFCCGCVVGVCWQRDHTPQPASTPIISTSLGQITISEDGSAGGEPLLNIKAGREVILSYSEPWKALMIYTTGEETRAYWGLGDSDSLYVFVDGKMCGEEGRLTTKEYQDVMVWYDQDARAAITYTESIHALHVYSSPLAFPGALGGKQLCVIVDGVLFGEVGP